MNRKVSVLTCFWFSAPRPLCSSNAPLVLRWSPDGSAWFSLGTLMALGCSPSLPEEHSGAAVPLRPAGPPLHPVCLAGLELHAGPLLVLPVPGQVEREREAAQLHSDGWAGVCVCVCVCVCLFIGLDTRNPPTCSSGPTG